MSNLQNQHTNTLRKTVAARFEEDKAPKSGLTQFFPRRTFLTDLIDVEVLRDSDTIAIDVERFTEGNHTKNSKSTEHTYRPPFFKENYDFNRDAVYMQSVANGILDSTNANQQIVENVLKSMRKSRGRIERAILKQQAQVLQTGTVTLESGDNIDFKRKAASMVDLGAGNYWNESGANPIEDIRTGLTFLRDEGGSSSSTANLIMRGVTLQDFLSNTTVKETANFRRISRLEISMPQFDDTSGLAFHGTFAAGDFEVLVWTYNEKYTDANGTKTYYLDENKTLLVPGDFEGFTGFGGLVTSRDITIEGQSVPAPVILETEFLVRPYYDPRTISSGLSLMSAPLVVPYTIDRLYTLQTRA